LSWSQTGSASRSTLKSHYFSHFSSRDILFIATAK
jgi:hypothetical protein